MISPDQLLRQAKMTGIDYLDAARHELENNQEYDNTFENAIRLAELMAKDFDTMMWYQSMESMREVLHELSDVLNQLAEATHD